MGGGVPGWRVVGTRYRLSAAFRGGDGGFGIGKRRRIVEEN
jgi:hypothetical protein